MPKICYIEKAFRGRSLELIDKSNAIIAQYTAAGFTLTLRQLYYQLVSQNIIANKPKEYDNLGALINDARYAGLVDWESLEDRTRNLRTLSAWENPASIIESAAQSYHINLWRGQPLYVEAWIEKDALVGVLEGVCYEWDVPHFSCRGYTSATEMWGAAQRILYKIRRDHKRALILHLGDHDPSGLDMTRDIRDRMAIFMRWLAPYLEVRRIALTRQQVDTLGLPPNPAKVTDSRAAAYIEEHGEESWELDALTPEFIQDLVREHIIGALDMEMFETRKERQEEDRKVLTVASDKWPDVADHITSTWNLDTGDGKEGEEE